MSGTADIGIIGMAVMGQNLALNFDSKGFRTAVYNRTTERTREFLAEHPDRELLGAETLQEFVAGLARPRRVLLMVKAGRGTDAVLEQLYPLLEPGDILIDGGNSLYTDTIRRSEEAQGHDLLYIGTGISGGEEGALKGPSIMPGGDPEAYEHVGEMLERISAHVDGEPCCTYIGPDGAGHFVKMVHNGIEYGDMQLIGEAYFLMKEALGMSAPEMHEVFAEWNQGELDSYLIEITADILRKIDRDTGKPMVDVILDRAGQKGTGAWTGKEALDLGVPAPTIVEAVFARSLSALKEQRVAAAKVFSGPEPNFDGDRDQFINDLRDSLYAAKICSYAQGFALLREAGREHHWQLRFGDIAKIWRGGCIIRARFLYRITDAFERDPDLPNLLLDPFFRDAIARGQDAWRRICCVSVQLGVPVPALTASLAYFDGYRTARLPANLLQAQRDYFGAHTYERVDRDGTFHTEWLED